VIDFDRSLGWKALVERLAVTDSPRQRTLIETVIAHAKAEADFDLDGLMATLVADPQYHFWVQGVDRGPKGAGGVREYYKAFVAGGGAVLSSPKERIIVDDNSLCTEGTITTLASGRIAKARGYHVDDESAHYLLGMRSTILWSFDADGRAFGEDSYSSIDPDDFEKVERAELPDFYVGYLESIGHEL
jgi:hypothetical protein